ncbi:MAG: hypothetical protein HOY78_18180 [Saccharothrix sp.]|nr:hypothetical protein [Saccharothrix sp.]
MTSEQRPTGYVLLADADCVDVHRFHRTSRSPDLATPWLKTLRTGLEGKRVSGRHRSD